MFETPNFKGAGESHPYADFSSSHPANTMFTLADGSVRPIADTIELEVFKSLGTIQGQENVPGDY